MIDPKLLRNEPEEVARNLARRGYLLDVAALKALEEKRKPWAVEADRLRAERNTNAKAVGMAKGRGEDAGALIARGEALTGELAATEALQAERVLAHLVCRLFEGKLLGREHVLLRGRHGARRYDCRKS